MTKNSGRAASTVHRKMASVRSYCLYLTGEGILEENPGPLQELLGGKEKVMGFFVGLIMKELKGKANPASVREALLAEVEKRK